MKEVIKMDYKKMIIEMIQKMENVEFLRKIYDFIQIPYERELREQAKEKNQN